MTINILIPLADGHRISNKTIKSIVMQDIDCDIIAISRPQAEDKQISMAESRNALKQYASKPYVVSLDSDAYFTSTTDISDSIKFLDSHPEWDAVALDTKGPHGETEHDIKLWFDKKERSRHVVMACMVMRYEAVQRIDFRTYFSNLCQCYCVNQDIKIRYLDMRCLGEQRRIN